MQLAAIKSVSREQACILNMQMRIYIYPKIRWVPSSMVYALHPTTFFQLGVYKFLWRGPDRVIRSAVISDYENGGLKVLDFETLVKSLRLAWLKRLFNEEAAGWKCYLRYLLKSFGGVFLLQRDFDPKDYEIDNRFYYELIQFWAEFRNSFSEQEGKTFIIWNNKNIRINGKPVFFINSFLKKS